MCSSFRFLAFLPPLTPLRRGLASTLSGNRLTPLQVLQVSNAFARAVIPDTSERVKTPPPDSEPQPDPAGTASSNPWIIDESECEELNNNRPKLAGEWSPLLLIHISYAVIYAI